MTIPRRVTRVILVLHGIVTLAAAAVLAVFPAAIPATVGIDLAPDAYLLSYFLAAAELGIGVLSITAARLDDPSAIRLIGVSFAIFHFATAVLEIVYLASEGVSGVLIANIVIRLIATAVFLLIGFSKRP